MLGFSLLWVAVWILSLIAVIWAIIDVLGQKKETGWKIIWIIATLVLGVIGVIIYYFVSGRSKGKAKRGK